MRRVVGLLLALSAAGLFVARASKFTTTADDIATFSTSVSISTPSTQVCNPTPFPFPAFVRATNLEVGPGAPTGVDANLMSKDIEGATTPIESQTDTRYYATWVAPVAPCSGYTLSGTVLLDIRQSPTNQRVREGLAAGLFDCPTTTFAQHSVGCTLLATGGVTAYGGAGRAGR